MRNSGHACVLARVLRSWARARARPLIGAEESIQPLERFLFVEAKRVSFFHVVEVVARWQTYLLVLVVVVSVAK